MRCEDLKNDLPLYADDGLDEEIRSAIESHLPSCPLCRQVLDEYREIRIGLRRMGNPPIPLQIQADLLAAIPGKRAEKVMFAWFGRERGILDKLSHWLMPFGAGAVGTAAFALLFLSFLFVRPATGIFEPGKAETNTIKIEALPYSPIFDEEISDLRVEIPESSPEVNPASALVALTRSIVRGDMNDEEVVVVADVFGNGIAHIAEVVEPPDDEEAMKELQRAFETEPDQAPFLPARMSRQSDAVRVVLKIQRVDVPN
ncbi:MAG: hypothetical protein DWQ47_17025 [Acidobacteria bacterium]|nr:MAG: hypothetical protein DWQ32_04425 [Acidobacteriota bacterium]REK02254.1 MAG: hypothetical protein DWQ38_07725 [Acidobacteriota bacterium]REK13943.1 MAG: hypothetical protein DWQ43_10115 [Acidobacteriota bacterium]REK41937.1 MAG: hypothetical protein DWQ47_17025 [Acidobacteriota bacterium]